MDFTGRSSTIVSTFLSLCTFSLRPPIFPLLPHVPFSLLSTFFRPFPLLSPSYFASYTLLVFLLAFLQHVLAILLSPLYCHFYRFHLRFVSTYFIPYSIQSGFIFYSSYESHFTSLSYVVPDSHECVNVGFTTLMTTLPLLPVGFLFCLGMMFLLHYIVFQF